MSMEINSTNNGITSQIMDLKTSTPGVTRKEEIKTGFKNTNDYSKYLQEKYSGVLSQVYKISISDNSPYEIFEKIAVSRGAIKKGGEIDEERASKMLINDLRKGKLGKIYFN